MSRRLKQMKYTEEASRLVAAAAAAAATVRLAPSKMSSHLYEEETGRGRRVVVDVHGDQHAGHHDERDQQDAQDEADVQRLVRAGDPIHGAVGRHHWRTTTRGNTLTSNPTSCSFVQFPSVCPHHSTTRQVEAHVLHFYKWPPGVTHHSPANRPPNTMWNQNDNT